jgi:hypothetical protein
VAAIAPHTVSNFGRNITFAPVEVHAPRTEAEVLSLLDRFRGRRIRVVGRLHSWSEATVADDVLLDLRHLNQVQIANQRGQCHATVGGGCQIKRLLAELDWAGATLPSVGLITEQTIAGAVSTGTHGSGKHSLSHYLDEVRIASYDAVTGRAIIRVINSGPELLAARCSLGCLGVIVSVGLSCRPQYCVAEHFREYVRLEDVLAAETEYPLQQFFLIPWRWTIFAQHRREVIGQRDAWASLYRVYFFVVFDVLLHLIVLGLLRVVRRPAWIQWFFRTLLPLCVIQNWKVVDTSQRMLVMEHELFRHIEMELFVRGRHLSEALAYVTEVLRYSAGDGAALRDVTHAQVLQLGLAEDLALLLNSYTHHYQISIRRGLPDETLLSMSSGSEEPSYAISLISYARPSERAGFEAVMTFLARSMSALFDARPHWGKFCPVTAEEVERLYPELPRFREVCEAIDPSGLFRNGWVNRVLFVHQASA